MKIANFERDAEFLELYGECDVYMPEDFQEYFDLKQGIDELCTTRNRLVEGLHFAFQSLVENEGQIPGEESWDAAGKIGRHEMQPISRENLKIDRREIKALMQIPFQYMPGLLGRTLWSTDPGASRYIGDGFFGALSHRERTGKDLSNFSVEMRFLRSGSPKVYIFDPNTLSTIPNIGAVVAPSRQKLLKADGPSPNPHKGYLYDGLSDPDANGQQHQLNNAPNSKGVFTAFRNTANKIETQHGAPRYHYTAPEDENDPTSQMVQKPLRKRGEIGTSLAPPMAGDPDSYTSLGIPAALGYKPTAPLSGRTNNATDDDQENNAEPSEKKSGGSNTFEKAWRRYIQYMAEHPGWFDQRTRRYLLHLQQQYIQNPAGRRDTGLAISNDPRPHMTHAAHRDESGKVRKRIRRQAVPYDPERSRVEPAQRVQMSDQARERMVQYFDSIVKNYTNPEWVQAKIEAARAMRRKPDVPTEQEKAWQKVLKDPSGSIKAAMALRDRYAQPTMNTPTYDMQDFGRGEYKVPTDMPHDGAARRRRTSASAKPQVQYKTKQEPYTDPKTGETKMRDVKQQHMLPYRKIVFNNLYTLTPWPGKEILISQQLAEQIQHRQSSGNKSEEFKGDGSKDDEVIIRNFGKSTEGGRLSFIVGDPVGSGPNARFTVHPANATFSKKKCCWAEVDGHGDVMFLYNKDVDEYTQPILVPGVLNRFMGGSVPAVYGGLSAAPQGMPEASPYEDDHRHLKSLYGPPDEHGKFDQSPDINSPPNTWQGLSNHIVRNVKWGVDYYINAKCPDEDMRKELREMQGDLINYSVNYAMMNLKNSKMLDFEEGHDVHFNLNYMKSQFPHLFAVLMQLDKWVKDDIKKSKQTNSPLYYGSSILPSRMTLEEFRRFLNTQHVNDALSHREEKGDDQGNVSQHSLLQVKMPNRWLVRRAKENEQENGAWKWKKGYAGKDGSGFAYQLHGPSARDENGQSLAGQRVQGPISPDAIRDGHSMINVGAPQIWQMVGEARRWYLRWIGKDMVRKIIQSTKQSQQGKSTRGGVFADGINIGLENSTNDARKKAIEVARARKNGVGVSKYNGALMKLIEEKRAAPIMLRREYEKEKAKFEAMQNEPNRKKYVDQAAYLITLKLKMNQSIAESAALRYLEINSEDIDPTWTDEDKQIWILKNLPEKARKYEEELNQEKHNKRMVATAMAANVKTPQDVMEDLSRRTGKSRLTERGPRKLGYNLITGNQRQRQLAMLYVNNLQMGLEIDLDEPEEEGEPIPEDRAVMLQHVLEYNAIETLISMVEDGLLAERAPEIRHLVEAIEKNHILPYFTYAAKIILGMHEGDEE